MNRVTNKVPGGRSADLASAQKALERAALRAREQAQRAGGSLVISRNGQVVLLPPVLEAK